MPTSCEGVARLYGKIAAHEDTRLASHPMERELTLRTIRQLLRAAGSQSRVADVGGGPGKIAFAIADEGHHVDLIDLSPDLIQLAEAEQQRRAVAGDERRLASIAVGNALEKPALTEGSYDAVLLLGPLYHLVEEIERKAAVENAIRLAKPQGVIFCAFVSIEAHVRDIAMRDPERLVKEKAFYAKYLENGRYEKPDSQFGISVQSFHTRSDDIRSFIRRHFAEAVDLVELRSTEGILGGGLDAKLAHSSDETVQVWADLMFDRYSKNEEHLGCADHLLAVLRRK